MSMTTNVFQTLMLREWMQHHKGWLALGLVPVVLMFLVTLFGSVSVDGGESGEGLLLLVAFGTAMMMVVLAMAAMVFQASGLARRDQQDRSIEFWLSLPVGQPQTLAAMLLMHVWLFPMMVVAIGLLGGLLIAPVAVVKALGLAGLSQMAWGGVLSAVPVATLRVFTGMLLAGLWALPFVLLMMAASVWLKRWGVPVLAAVVGLGGLVLEKAYQQTWLLDSVRSLGSNVGAALFPGAAGNAGLQVNDKMLMSGHLEGLNAWLMMWEPRSAARYARSMCSLGSPSKKARCWSV
ncbi:MAG: hypothetical protein C4K60_05025 [Ideonella sp. MAG2]|nr:MAG: hypothetical protein C4K60_05025 [Ideonella sp. MAG2]